MPVFHGWIRVVIVLMRSVHELLWAVLFLAAFGLNSFGAVIAISIPYGGTLAKVFSEDVGRVPARIVAQLAGDRPRAAFKCSALASCRAHWET